MYFRFEGLKGNGGVCGSNIDRGGVHDICHDAWHRPTPGRSEGQPSWSTRRTKVQKSNANRIQNLFRQISAVLNVVQKYLWGPLFLFFGEAPLIKSPALRRNSWHSLSYNSLSGWDGVSTATEKVDGWLVGWTSSVGGRSEWEETRFLKGGHGGKHLDGLANNLFQVTFFFFVCQKN